MARAKWNVTGIEDFAKDHTIKECAEHYSCSCIAMQHYLYRHKLQHKSAEKGVKGSRHYLYKHGSSRTRLYSIWFGMKRRCQDPRSKDFACYEAKGIKVCKEWNNDFSSFKAWSLIHGYSEKLSIDRIDNSKGYSPENCRWATMKEQQNNRSSNRFVTYNGETKTVKQ